MSFVSCAHHTWQRMPGEQSCCSGKQGVPGLVRPLQLCALPCGVGCVWIQEGDFLEVWKHHGKAFSKLAVVTRHQQRFRESFKAAAYLCVPQTAARFLFLPAVVKEWRAALAGCVASCRASL